VALVEPTDAYELEDFVEAYESSRQSQGNANLIDFLPAPSHRLYREVATELVRVDMELSWANSDRQSLEDYCRLLPELFADADVLKSVAYEEYRLRVQQGETVEPEEYSRRYAISTDNWARFAPQQVDRDSILDQSQIDTSRNVVWNDALRLVDDTTEFPASGDDFLDFHLERELGSGAFARVFLARQGELADRRVVLKIASGQTLEPQHLARLQHTNIVPVYSVHQSGELTAVCMPYFGSRTLADVVSDLDQDNGMPLSGQALFSTLGAQNEETQIRKRENFAQTATKAPVDSESNVREDVERPSQASYTEAVVWLMAQIAEGLQHAHERGIVHRDLKPANILLTDDGRAMILDFNLSENLIVNGPTSLAVGGTLPYMSPEHLAAVAQGGTVDFRSDIYSLGMIFFELLTGARPFPVHRGSFEAVVEQMLEDRRDEAPAVRCLNADVRPAVESIVARCLQTNPQDRYQAVDDLHEDLGRHLANLPLRHAPNPSLKERVVKWARRHPRMSSAASVATVALVLLSVLGLFGLRLWAVQAHQQFTSGLPAARMALSIPEYDPQLLEDGMANVRHSLEQYGVSDDVRWHRPLKYRALAASNRAELDVSLGELAYLMAAATAKSARADQESVVLEEAIKWNQLASSILPREQHPQAFALQRAELLESLGRPAEAAEAHTFAANQTQHGPLDGYLNVHRLLSDLRFEESLPLLTALRDGSPTNSVYWFLLGNAHAGLAQFDKAEGCFSTSAALLPESYLALHHRGLCRMDLREYESALEDFDAVMKMRPDLPPCLLNRALAYASLGHHREALADFTTALERGATQTRVYFLRARSYEKIGNPKTAAEDRATGLRLTPTDKESWIARGIARLAKDPEGALADFRQALAMNPRSLSALKNIVHVTADRLDHPKEALASLNRILEIDDTNLFALAGRAVMLARQGKRTEALADVQELLRASKKPTHLFQAACALSHTSTVNEADIQKGLLMLTRAVLQDPRLLARAQTDPDLEQLRKNPGFQDLVAAARRGR
jgi:serine/threonine protein kinase/tetratricopeptide (TPR) repeat protein